MCMLCVEYELGKLTWDEAWANAGEIQDIEHATEIKQKLVDDMWNEYTKDTVEKDS